LSAVNGASPGLVSIDTPLRALPGLEQEDLLFADAVTSLAERIAGDLPGPKLVVIRSGRHERELLTKRIATALRLLVRRPFCRLQDVADACHCDIDQAIGLIRSIYEHPEAATFLGQSSGDAPYRESTIRPLIESGAVRAFLDGEYRYPFTIGIYPAVTCMLSCNFCARARGMQYKQEDIVPGNALLRQVFAEAPQDSPRRFYLSGGLEPLTNPGLAELVRFAAGFGHRMQLYTNAMMLTDRFLARNEGLWHLETLRISFYGADDEAAQLTTQRSGVATRVIANAKNLVRAKSERGSKLRIGFNHVVQSGQIAHLRKIAETLVSIADQSPDRRGIDFLTLRENYAATGETAIDGAERERLRDELIRVQDFFVAEGMEDFVVDLGYGMRRLVEGMPTAPVRRVAHTDMLGRGYPQISIVIDLLGDVYLYREAGFIGRLGADRYIIGRLTPELSLPELLQRYLADQDRFVAPRAGDEIFLDAFDHAVTAFLRQAGDDLHFGSNLSGLPMASGLYQAPANLWR
jgi:dTDP-4-amino-4,6-dideoxy-D-glucose ammonia-lyase